MLVNNQQGIPYITGPKREGVPYCEMIKLKLKFLKSMWNKITKKESLKNQKKEKSLHDTKTLQQ